MADIFTFLPNRSRGVVIHVIIILLLMGGCSVLVWQAFQQSGGIILVLDLLGAVVLFGFLPIVGYRGYALINGIYSLKRDGLRIRWGLRAEDIPLSEVTWVRPATDLETPLRLPAFSITGALLGYVDHPDLGQLEFIASDAQDLVIVATLDRYFVLSPENKEEFVQRFQRALEMGTLTPMEAYSAIPAAFLRQIVLDKYGRALIPAGFGLTLSLLVIVGLSISSRVTVSLGYDPNGLPLPPVDANQLLLLPVLGVLLYIAGTVAGVYFYRRPESRPVAWLVWTGSLLTPMILIVAAGMLVGAG
ncbi:MAG: hypothetical protein CVU42_07030 [Chloroflexi bacterium HGW-Chloroflexi-4]|jgi:hypothetical protein|nr:MAG: hypothetical protein CVU42_07030 [Chloroflexi bacterium HGW-Chloroflexi-4]